jgi:hypothetical protein
MGLYTLIVTLTCLRIGIYYCILSFNVVKSLLLVIKLKRGKEEAF